MKTLFTFVAVALLSATSFAQETQQQKTPLSEAEKLHIAVQKICPVSGQKLGAMGDPIQVKFGEQIAFLCCKGCQGKDANAEHWKTIQSNLAAAQGTCPIMGKPVTGESKSTVVNGHRVFVCCPPCIDKIKARPELYIEQLNALYAASGELVEKKE